jgi:hypothetical protein
VCHYTSEFLSSISVVDEVKVKTEERGEIVAVKEVGSGKNRKEKTSYSNMGKSM